MKKHQEIGCLVIPCLQLFAERVCFLFFLLYEGVRFLHYEGVPVSFCCMRVLVGYFGCYTNDDFVALVSCPDFVALVSCPSSFEH